MPPITETEIKELRDLVVGLREEIRVGFANNNTKFAELRGEIQKVEAELKGEILRVEAKTDAKFAEIQAELKGEIQRVEGKTDTKLAEIKGQVDLLEDRTQIGFWGFIWRSVIIGILILVSGFAVRYVLFGTLRV
jgi:predicted lipoprotein